LQQAGEGWHSDALSPEWYFPLPSVLEAPARI